MDKIKIILSGGGTGGHIYPAVAVAEALQRRLGDGVELLFVGAEGKMGDGEDSRIGLPHRGVARGGAATAADGPQPVVAVQGRRVAPKGPSRDPQLRGRRSGRFRRLCERTGAVERPAHGYSDADPGAELLRRGDEQAARIAGQTHLRGLRGDGAFLSEGAHRDDGQSVARTFCRRGGPGSTEGRSIGLFRARSG